MRPTAGEPDGPSESDWASPPIQQAEPSGVHDGTSHGLPGVDAEVSSMVDTEMDKAVKQPSTAPETSATEIDIEELGLDGTEEGGETLQTQSVAHIRDSEFDSAPRAPGVISVPPPQGRQQSASSLLAISTLIRLEQMVGHELSAETKENGEGQAAALKSLLVEGKWPEDEDATRVAMITILKELQPKYQKSDRWTKQGFMGLKNLFLQELQQAKDDEPKALAAKLRTKPPPIPKAPRPGK